MTSSAAPATQRPGGDRCPGVLRLHPAEDGGLARIRLPGGRIEAAQVLAVAAAGRAGNGIIEVTSRANLQVRGLSDRAADEVGAVLAAAGLLPSPAHDRVRNVVASPLAGRHPRSVAPTDELVGELDRGLCADPRLAALPGRFLFAVDDGAGLTPAPDADVRLTADRRTARFRLALAGQRTTLDGAPAEAAELALAAARTFLEARAAHGGGAWRLRELPDGPREVARGLGGDLTGPAELPAPRELAPGSAAQADGRVAVTALPPLGRLDPDALDALAALAGEVRLSVARTLSLVDLDGSREREVLGALEGLGLVVAPASGWEGLSACAGMGACRKAKLDVRAAATRRAAERGADDPIEHWSACERRCGEPADVSVAVFAGAAGLTIERDGERRTAPLP